MSIPTGPFVAGVETTGAGMSAIDTAHNAETAGKATKD